MDMETDVQNSKKRNKQPLIIIALVSILTLGYLLGACFFQTHFGFRTFVNGVDCSLCDMNAVKERLKEQAVNYRLQIIGRDGVSDEISAAELPLQIHLDDAAISETMISQPILLWPKGLFQRTDLELGATASFDETTLGELISGLTFFEKANLKSPVDACLSEYQESTNSFEIIPEEQGTQPNYQKTLQAISLAIGEMDSQLDLESAACYVAPKVLASDQTMINLAAKANKIVSSKVVYDWNGEEITVDVSTFRDWFEIRGFGIYFNDDLISEYLAECAYAHDTYGKSAVFTTVNGSTRELKRSGFGWKCDREAELLQLKKDLQTGEEIHRTPIYAYEAPATGEQDYGTSYVEVDLGLQHVYVLIEGEIVYETDCVSGNMSNGSATPPGIFDITYKEKDATLRGETYTSHVHFWMPFNGDIGMHDATWRSEFGGDIYLTSGSHGCVNLPYSAAKTIYDYVSKDFPVICYY